MQLTVHIVIKKVKNLKIIILKYSKKCSFLITKNCTKEIFSKTLIVFETMGVL